MRAKHNPLVHWAQYLAARLAVMGVTCFDADANLRTAAGIGRVLCRCDPRHRRRAAGHVALCFPQLDAGQVDRLVAGSFAHFVQLIVEICHTPRIISPDSWPQRVQLANMGPAIRILNSGKPALLLTGHVGNWEILGYTMATLGYHMHALARPLDNPLIYRWLLSIRQKRGLEVITKWDATDTMLQVLGDNGLLGFIADQNAGDRGLFVPFFGRLASTYKSIGLLAISQQVPIICGYARRIGPGCRYELGTTDVIHPEEWADRADPLYYVTARYMRALEMMVRNAPEQYLWMHRRWKSRPKFEREGKPMPAALRRSLEALPWMDQTTLDQVAQPVPFVP